MFRISLPDISLNDYFLAYIDISGFKNMMDYEPSRSIVILRDFYQIGYNCLTMQDDDDSVYNSRMDKNVVGFFFSDMGLLVSRNRMIHIKEQFEKLLDIVTQINEKMYETTSCFLTTSISYGKFQYVELAQNQSVNKTSIYGQGFLDVYLDSEDKKNKLQPGSCRIIKNTLPKIVEDYIKSKNTHFHSSHVHYYYYWMINQCSDTATQIHKKFERVRKKVNKGINQIYTDKYQTLMKRITERKR